MLVAGGASMTVDLNATKNPATAFLNPQNGTFVILNARDILYRDTSLTTTTKSIGISWATSVGPTFFSAFATTTTP